MAQTAQLRRIEHPDNEAQRIFQLQREAYLAHPYPSLDERRAWLRALERTLLENRDAIATATRSPRRSTATSGTAAPRSR
jgi:coniferyl-aldehyde dehydrogenase